MKIFSYALAAIIITFLGCKNPPDSPVTNNYYYSTDSLTDPTIKPKVIFTNPANGAVGPFVGDELYTSHIYPQIFIQFNKFMDVVNFNSNSIRLTTKEGALPLSLLNFGYSPNGLFNILVYGFSYKYFANKVYTVTVDTTLLDANGYKLSSPYVFSYTPEPQFRVYSGSPSSYTDTGVVDPESFSPITIDLNSKIDSTFFSKIQISPPINGQWVINPYSPYSSSPSDSTAAYFISRDTLQFDTKYTVSVSAGGTDVNGLLMKAPYQFSFTSQPFAIINSSWSSSTGPGGFTVIDYFDFVFNGFIDTSSVRSSISITPSISFNLSFYTVDGGFLNFLIYPDVQQMQRNTTYTATINNTVRSIKGAHLKSPYSLSLTTGI